MPRHLVERPEQGTAESCTFEAERREWFVAHGVDLLDQRTQRQTLTASELASRLETTDALSRAWRQAKK